MKSAHLRLQSSQRVIWQSSLTPEGREARANLHREVGVSDGTQPQKRAVMFDGSGRVSTLIGYDSQVVMRSGVARIDCQRDAELRCGNVGASRSHQRHTEIVVRFGVLRIDRDCPLKLFERVLELPVILIQQPEIVVNFDSPVVLLEERPVMYERVVEIGDLLIVERESEVIRGRQARRLRRHGCRLGR